MRLILATFVMFLGLSIHSVFAQQYRIFIHPSSKVKVYGSTNVNSFKFDYTEEITIDKPVNVRRQEGSLKLSGGYIDLKVKSFDSGNGIMNKDFRKMLMEEENPFIQVELLDLKPKWIAEHTWLEGKAEIAITINQIIKQITVNCKVENPGSLLIYGRQRVLLTDFGLTPPVRMMGMVKVNEWVDLDFELRFATDR